MDEILERILNVQLKHLKHNCPKNITDLVFLEIEKLYLKEYKEFVNYKSSLSVNQYIGKFIKEYWNLRNCGRCNSPKSKLISSYEKHSN